MPPLAGWEVERLPLLGEFLAALVSPALQEEEGVPAEPERGPYLETLVIDLPFELSLWQDGEGLQLDASPPTQRTATTYLPVLHQLRIRVIRDDGGASDHSVES